MPVYILGNGDDHFDPRQAVGWTDGSVVYGGDGNDVIDARGISSSNLGSRNTAYGENGDDTLVIGGGRTSGSAAFGGDGDDTLSVVSGLRHVLDGGPGDDRLISASAAVFSGDPSGEGTLMTGGPGHDTYVLDSRSLVRIGNIPTRVLSEGDAIYAVIDVIEDYQAGELIDLPGTPGPGPVGFDAVGRLLTTSGSDYGIVRGVLGESNRFSAHFTVAAGGGDLLLVYQQDGPFPPVGVTSVDGAVAIRGGGSAVLVGSANAEVYRFFRNDLGTHFYTSSAAERDFVANNFPNYNFEGVAYFGSDPTAPGAIPVYRFLAKGNGSHFYTASAEERDYVQATLSELYSFEGPGYYASATPKGGFEEVYRFYNKVLGTHFYTASEAERAFVNSTLGQTYNDEGVRFYVPTTRGSDPIFDL